MTAPRTVTVWVDHHGGQVTWDVADALDVAEQILLQAGPQVYASGDAAESARLVHLVSREEARSASIDARSMRGRRVPMSVA